MHRDDEKIKQYFRDKLPLEEQVKLKSEELLKKVHIELEEVGIFQEAVIIAEKKETLKTNKKKVTVYNITGNSLVVVDSSGNGFKIPITEEYKNAKLGDTIYI
jgi:hypothetical protein